MPHTWIWESPDWPEFRWDAVRIAPCLARARLAQGKVLGAARWLDADLTLEAVAAILVEDGLTTSAIEGEVLLRYPVRIGDPAQRAAVMRGLKALDIVPGVWFDDVVHPVGSLRYGYEAGTCPEGEAAARAVLNLPLGLHAELTPRQLQGLRALAHGLPGQPGRSA